MASMSDDLLLSLQPVVEKMLALAAQDNEFRTCLRAFAEKVLVATDREEPLLEIAVPQEMSSVIEVGIAPSLPELTLEPSFTSSPASVPLPTNPTIEVPVGWVRRQAACDADLAVIEARCKLKAEGARWAATRQRRLQEGAIYDTEIAPKDRDIIDKAKSLPDCFLWMNHPSGPSPADLSLYDNLAACFEVVGAAIALTRSAMSDNGEQGAIFEQSLDLLAESQSALRASVEAIDGPRDTDQQRVYEWLRSITAERQVYLQRYMRLDDPADPTTWRDIEERIDALDARLQDVRQREKRLQAGLKRVRYHAKVIQEKNGSEHDWRVIGQTVDEMVVAGMPPSNRELREILLPVVDAIPDVELPENFQAVLRELDRVLATSTPPLEPESIDKPTNEVQEAARLLSNKSVVLIGGERRPHAYQSLKASLKLKELNWIATRDHESLDVFAPHVARQDVALVLLAIRWSSHSYGEVAHLCDQHGKPLVRLPGGYSPNQVAAQIIQQCGNRLKSQDNG